MDYEIIWDSNDTNENQFGFYVDYFEKDEDNINYETFEEAKVEYDLFVSRGERDIKIIRYWGYEGNNEVVYPNSV
jgi:hypothetical protein